MTTYFTSDNHFSHAKILGYCSRPFASIEAMDAEMEHRWNERVQPDDRIYHLGDFSFGPKEAIARRAAGLNGHKVLILGNHDLYHFKGKHSRHPERFDKAIDFFRSIGFEEVYTEHVLQLDGRRLLLTHVPAEVRKTRTIEQCHFNLCGHVHEHWARQGAFNINVGVDVRDFRPVTLAELLA